jgi:DNA polymerase-3 subunit epsilon
MCQVNLDTINLASIDVESTGLDASADKIITLGVCVSGPNNPRLTREWRFNPGRPIPEASTKIHGITNENVANLPLFSKEAGEQFLAMIAKCDVLLGYNLTGLDIPIIIEELDRVGCGGRFPASGVIVIDACVIFKQKEPRDLTAAVAKFCNRKHEGAHGAAADAEATLDVLRGQLMQYTDLAEMPAHELADWCGGVKRVDWSGVLERREDGEIVFTHKKVKGIPLKQDIGYAEWILRSGFNSDTKKHVRAILSEAYGEGESLFD